MALLDRMMNEMQLMFRRPPKQQYAALCYRRATAEGQLDILLITSRGTGRWVIPKGNPIDGLAAPGVALREAFEEAGVEGLVTGHSLGCYTYLKAMNSDFGIECKVQVYAVEVTALASDFPEAGQRKLAWFAPETAATMVAEPELAKLILDLQDSLGCQPT